MNKRTLTKTPRIRCAIYTRKSSEEGLEQSFNSLQAQREACEAYIKSQRHEGWILNQIAYDDGGFSGGNMERPALARLLAAIKQGLVNIIVVYKVDRLSRSLADFIRMIELFDQYKVSFVSVTQQFNTSTSMGRLTLNVLLSFAQFEREVTGERIRDKIAASKQKGMWMGGVVPLGYDVADKRLVVNEPEAKIVRHIYARYLVLGCVRKLKAELDNQGYVSKVRKTENGITGGRPFSRGALYTLLKNPLYIGKIAHHGHLHEGEHKPLVGMSLWDQVQEKLSENRIQRHNRTSAKAPCLLAGLLYDDQGNPMSPSHAAKGNRRYRYYVSQALLQFRESDEGSVTRLAAKTIEDLVTADIKRLLRSGHELMLNIMPDNLTAIEQKKVISNASTLSDNWDAQPPGKQIEKLKRIIEGITVSQQRICIDYSKHALAGLLLNKPVISDNQKDSEADNYRVTVPVCLKRCGLETRLVIPGKQSASAHPTSIQAIQEALAKALTWNQALITGKAKTMTELAKAEGVTQRYIAHIIKMAFLSPDIMEVIIKGNIPENVTLGQLKREIPQDWKKQRDLFGFA